MKLESLNLDPDIILFKSKMSQWVIKFMLRLVGVWGGFPIIGPVITTDIIIIFGTS